MSLVDYNFNFPLLYLFYSGIFAAVLAVGQLIVSPKKKGNYLLFLLFLSIAILLLIYSLQEGGFVSLDNSAYEYFLVIFHFFIGPIMYYVFKYFFISRSLNIKVLVDHLLRITIFCALLSLFYVLTVSKTKSYLSFLFNVSLFVFNFYYLLAFKLILQQYRRVIDPQRRFYAPLLMLFVLGFFNHVYLIVSSFFGYPAGTIYLIMGTSFLYISYFYSGRHPEYLLIPGNDVSSSGSRTYLSGVDIDASMASIHDTLLNGRIYRSQDITLLDLAGLVGLSTHQLSEIINRNLKTSFYELINRYRIQEACYCLAVGQENNVKSIASRVGFKSLSSFYNAFKEHTGKTPTEYRAIHR